MSDIRVMCAMCAILMLCERCSCERENKNIIKNELRKMGLGLGLGIKI